LLFVPSGNFKPAMETLCKKASKAMYKLKSSLYKLNVPPKLTLYLYDTLVRPISTYAAEVWGSFIKAKDQAFNIGSDKYELFDNHCFEKLYLKFCKSILGVHKNSCNAAVRGELGKYPTLIFILKQVLKNWFRISSYNQKHSILYDTYMCNLTLQKNLKYCWLTNITTFFKDRLGFSSIFENQGVKGKNNIKIQNIVKSMETIFEFQWRNELSRTKSKNKKDGNKLRTYYTFKKDFSYERYLDFERIFTLRTNITKLRISAHKLEIETGRYSKNKIKINSKQRVCKHCTSGEIEDEQHVIMSCSKYINNRTIMVQTLTEAFPFYELLDYKNKFLFIMKCNDYEVTHALSKMLSDIKVIRGAL